jgi:hypothetical protein
MVWDIVILFVKIIVLLNNFNIRVSIYLRLVKTAELWRILPDIKYKIIFGNKLAKLIQFGVKSLFFSP